MPPDIRTQSLFVLLMIGVVCLISAVAALGFALGRFIRSRKPGLYSEAADMPDKSAQKE